MKITALETVNVEAYPQITFVQIHTDEGLVGLGDTFFGSATVQTYVHEVAAPLLLGTDPLAVEAHWNRIFTQTVRGGLSMRSAEMRGLSAIDVALWDIAGQALGLPLYRLLGGPTRDSLRVYNTCAGYRYGGRRPAGWTANYTDGQSEGPYEDLDAFLNRADELAESLLSEGYRAMKIWPFDQFGPATNGQQISAEDIARGCEPFEKIRRAVGNKIEIALEMHSVFGLPAAQRIARTVEQYDPLWFEDPVRMDNLDALLQFRQSTRIPTTASETMSTRWQFREAFERGALSIVMFDLGWVGGLSEARKIATMAEAYQLPIAPHDCVGPITLIASVHLDYAVPNVFIQEVVRAYLHGVYPNLVTELPKVADGAIRPLEGPGLGTKLLPDLRKRPDANVRVTRAE
ncbi:MAG: mandelate racemase/muconate lactonizing enzyme family protein [Chloroflexota bacterium]